MIPRPDNSRPYNSRLDNLISWFAASVIVTAGVIYGLKLQEDRGKPKPERALARATPAQEPLTWQERRAAERGRGRQARKPMQISGRGWTDIFVRTYWEIQSDRLLALAAGVVFYSLGRVISGDRGGSFFLRAVRQCRYHRQASLDRC
jgi:hypothetical protein